MRKSKFLLFSKIFIFSLLTNNLYGQKNISENDSLYVKALEDYIVEHEKNPNKYIPKNKLDKVLYIKGEDYLFHLPKIIKGYEIVFLWPDNEIKYLKSNNNYLLLIKIYPLSIENKVFDIGINEFYVELKKKMLNYIRIGMSTKAYFKYESEKLIHIKTEFGGDY